MFIRRTAKKESKYPYVRVPKTSVFLSADKYASGNANGMRTIRIHRYMGDGGMPWNSIEWTEQQFMTRRLRNLWTPHTILPPSIFVRKDSEKHQRDINSWIENENGRGGYERHWPFGCVWIHIHSIGSDSIDTRGYLPPRKPSTDNSFDARYRRGIIIVFLLFLQIFPQPSTLSGWHIYKRWIWKLMGGKPSWACLWLAYAIAA